MTKKQVGHGICLGNRLAVQVKGNVRLHGCSAHQQGQQSFPAFRIPESIIRLQVNCRVEGLPSSESQLALANDQLFAVQGIKAPVDAKGAEEFKNITVFNHIQMSVQLHLHIGRAYPGIAGDVDTHTTRQLFHKVVGRPLLNALLTAAVGKGSFFSVQRFSLLVFEGLHQKRVVQLAAITRHIEQGR